MIFWVIIMKQVKVLLNDVDRIVEFVNILERANVNADLGQGNIKIDARSMIGVMTMDTKNPVTLMINENDEKADMVLEKIKSYIVEQ